MTTSTSLSYVSGLPAANMDPVPAPMNQRTLSHQEYLDTLIRPSPAEIRRISDVQLQKEQATAAKYHSKEELDAAKLIQRAYRGHRERRQLNGLALDPSSRWVEIIKEWQYRSATAPHLNYINCHLPDGRARSKSASEHARINWRRAETIAKHAGAGESSPAVEHRPKPTSSFGSRSKNPKDEEPSTMLLDLRYFLEMVDQKHRYGANLQVYHQQWQQSKTDQNFFHWLDYGEGRDLDLSMCSREKLERERIRYLSKEERQDYLVQIDLEGKLRWAKNGELITTSVERYQDSMHGIVPKGSPEPSYTDPEAREKADADASFSTKLAAVGGLFRDTLLSDNASQFELTSSSSSSLSGRSTKQANEAHHKVANDKTPGVRKKKKFYASPATILNHLLRASVRPGTWIYVADTVGRLYVGIKSSGAFQHASFLSGARLSSAGIIGIEEGKLIYLSPLSGHYRPTTKSFRRFIDSLKDQGVDMRKTKVSKSYAVLLGMECYGRSKKDIGKVLRPGHDEERQRRKQARSNERVAKRLAKKHGEDPQLLTVSSNTVGTPQTSISADATEDVERYWKAEQREKYREPRRRGLSRVIEDLHVRRKSQDTKSKV